MRPDSVQLRDDGTRAMKPYSTLEPTSPEAGVARVAASVGAKSAELQAKQTVEENNPTRVRQASVSAALVAARAETNATLAAGVRFPGEDGGRSLADMAESDLDAALQLLADRAQYITGASGAAIALRRNGKNDMLCRASAGSNAPELGALLSTEYGLSGESVRTRQPLRCDDAERDARVNREVCRQMGIASVVVMPVVNDDEVLGVFELFSGKANAFGARDVSAVQRLSEMVETAVRLAHATENLPERLKRAETSAPVKEAEILEDQVLDAQVVEELVLEESVLDEPVEEVTVAESTEKLAASRADAPTEKESPIAPPRPLPAGIPTPSKVSGPALTQKAIEDGEPTVEEKATALASPEPVAPAKKKLFWSAALNPAADAGRREEADQSHVPPVLRSLRKCEACGFPVSAGRALCVECEEKKWRGQKVGQAARPAAVPAPAIAAAAVPGTAAGSQPGKRAIAVPVPVAASTSVTLMRRESADVAPSTDVLASPAAKVRESKVGAEQATVATPTLSGPVPETGSKEPEIASPEFVFSAGLEPSQSWLAANKYMIGVLLVVAAVVGAFLILR